MTGHERANTITVVNLLREAQFLYGSNGKGDHEAARRICEVLDQDPFLPGAIRLKTLVLLILLEQDRVAINNILQRAENLYTALVKLHPKVALQLPMKSSLRCASRSTSLLLTKKRTR